MKIDRDIFALALIISGLFWFLGVMVLSSRPDHAKDERLRACVFLLEAERMQEFQQLDCGNALKGK